MNNYELFIKVVELKSFTAAAKALNRTPSAISKQINTLETKLGVQLLNRTTRALSITNAGSLYYQRCLDITKKIESAEAELRDYSTSPSGQLNVTWPSVLSSSSIIRSLGDFSAKFPDIKIHAKITNDCINLIQEGYDFAIRSYGMIDLVDSSLIAIKLGDIQPICCAAPSLLKQYGQPNSIRDIFNMPQVIPTYLPLAQALKKFAPDLESLDETKHHKVSEVHALYHMVKAGLGVGFIGQHVVEQELKNGSLVNLTGLTLPKLPIYLVFPKLSYQPNINRCFIDHFKSASFVSDDS